MSDDLINRRFFVTALGAIGGNAISGSARAPVTTSTLGIADHFSVRAYGARGDGATDDTEAIRVAISEAQKSGGGRVVIPPGGYRVTDTIVIPSNCIHLQGAGMGATTFYFDPPSPRSCIRFQKVTKGLVALCGISDVSFDSPANKIPKVAIEIVDGSDISVSNIACVEGSWDCPGGSGLVVRGRELIFVERFTFAAEQPIRIASNPNSAYIGCDMSTFRRLYLIGRGKEQNSSMATRPLFQIDGDTVVSNLTIDGFIGARGSHGFYWQEVSSPGIAQNIDLRNIRREQSPQSAVNNFAFHLERKSRPLYNLRIQNMMLGGHKSTSPANGILIDGVRHGTLDGSMYEGDDAIGLRVGAEDFAWRGCYWAAGSQLQLIGKTRLQTAIFSPNESRAIPATGRVSEA